VDMISSRLFSRRSALLCATILISSGPLHAQAVRVGLDLSAEAEATSNPYLDQTSNDWVGAGSLEVRPWLVSETSTERVELEAFARGRAFTSGFDFEDSFGGSVRASHRASPRTSFYGQANVVSTSARSNFTRFNRSGFDLDPLAPGDPAVPTQPIDPATGGPLPVIVPPLDDLAIVGFQGRTTTLAISAGMNRQVDTRSTLSANVDYNRLWVEGGQISGYESVSAGVTYSRRLNARTSVGLAVNAGQSRYDDAAFPKATTLGAYVSAEHQLNQYWTLSGAVGVSSSSSPASGLQPEIDEVSVAGNVNLCRSRDQSRLCVGLSRSQQPSTLGQVRTSDAIDFSYSERLSARDRVDIYANYARSNAPSEVATPFDEIEIASVGATFTRVLSPRLDSYLFGRASRSYGGYLTDEPSISFGIGLRARLGDRR
jgi:hypothetical protein